VVLKGAQCLKSTFSFFRIKTVDPSLKRKQECTYSISVGFFVFLEHKPSQVGSDFDGHICWLERSREAKNFLTCHLHCTFKAGNPICTIIPKEMLGASVVSLALLYTSALSLKKAYILGFTIYQPFTL
jgi:hypothetical protein